MSPSGLREALALLRWSQRGLAEALACDDRLVRRWAAGDALVPSDVASWLLKLATVHGANPPPQGWRSRRVSPAMEEAVPGSRLRKAHSR